VKARRRSRSKNSRTHSRVTHPWLPGSVVESTVFGRGTIVGRDLTVEARQRPASYSVKFDSETDVIRVASGRLTLLARGRAGDNRWTAQLPEGPQEAAPTFVEHASGLTPHSPSDDPPSGPRTSSWTKQLESRRFRSMIAEVADRA